MATPQTPNRGGSQNPMPTPTTATPTRERTINKVRQTLAATPTHLRASVVHLTHKALKATAEECGVPADVFDDPNANTTNQGGEASRAQIDEAVRAVRGPAGANPINDNPYNSTETKARARRG
ncbi:hypothetical protein LTR70_005737 [Exophiala xenobiotica]|uniref:Uncharacterized protein n=1 Tax=Lithohypha guttulata TaxID=1690604 RepID=A0ABR0K984_9EURO|nr:hypothetical protein LTR24_005474 [Lithohypha guttulata]KAK5317631.1 hypothetical protein LTR70_005737 [Exophiala xenobiotica]